MQCESSHLCGYRQRRAGRSGGDILLCAPYDGTDLGDQHGLAEWLGHIIVRAETKTLYLGSLLPCRLGGSQGLRSSVP